MWSPNSSPYSKSKSSWPDFSTGIASFSPAALACGRDRRRRTARRRARRSGRRATPPLATAFDHPLVDQVLGVGDRRRLLGRRVALDPEHLLLERPAMVEREDVQLAVVAEGHGEISCRCRTSVRSIAGVGWPRAWSTTSHGPNYTLGIEEELMILDAESLDLVNAIESLLERRAGRRDQARADGVGARDLDRPAARHRAAPASSCARCARR